MSIRIEICKSFDEEKWRLRIGDIEGSSESSNISKEEVLDEINDAMDELDGKEI